MKLTVSAMGVIGVAIAILSVNATWLTFEVDVWESERSLTEFGSALGRTSDADSLAYSMASYLVIVGIAISASSLLGGFVVLAGVCSFAIGRLVDNTLPLRTIGDTALEGSLSLGIGFYMALTAAVVVVLSIAYPLDVSIGGRTTKPKFRTWCVGRK